MERIFLFLNSFDDSEVKTTVDSAIDNAAYPERIDFGIYEQRSDADFEDFSDLKYENVIRVKAICELPMGTGIARANAIMMHSYQEYTLSVDAHTLFVKNWDIDIIAEFKRLKQIHKKPIISERLPGWRRVDGKIVSYDATRNFNTSDIFYSKDLLVTKEIKSEIGDGHRHLSPDGSHEYTQSIIVESEKDVASPFQMYLVSGHFIFAHTQFFIDHMWNLDLAFYGEEQVMAMRAWTNGYKIFGIERSYFAHKGKDMTSAGEIDSSGPDANWRNLVERRNWDPRFKYSPLTFVYESNLDYTCVYKILTGKLLGYWGAKNKRRYKKYIRRLGYDYRKRYTRLHDKDFTDRIKRSGV